MEIFAIVALPGLAIAAGCAVVAILLSAGDGWAVERGATWIALTVLLCLLSYGSLLAIALKDMLLAFIIGIFGHDSPSTTDLDRLGWLAIPFLVLATSSAAAVLAAWLWGRPWGRHASFPIVSALAVFAWWMWRERGW